MKKLFCFILFLILICVPVTIFASPSDSEMIEYAENFAREFTGEDGIYVRMCSLADDSKYILEFDLQEIHYGYMTVQKQENACLILDFCLEPGVTYFLDDKYSSLYGKISPFPNDDIFVDEREGTSVEYRILSSFKATTFGYWVEATEKYCCTVAAMTNIAIYKGYSTREGTNYLTPTYNALFKLCNVIEEGITTQNFNGTTYTFLQYSSADGDACNGLKRYIESMGGTCRYESKANTDVTFEWFRQSINYGYPCVLFYRYPANQEVGHCINIHGYYVYRKGAKDYNYLAVKDGYNYEDRYLLLDSIDPSTMTAARFIIN